jgi:hypothetical protein
MLRFGHSPIFYSSRHSIASVATGSSDVEKIEHPAQLRIALSLFVILDKRVIAAPVDNLTISQDSQPSWKVLIFDPPCYEKLDALGDIRCRKGVIGIAFGLRK